MTPDRVLAGRYRLVRPIARGGMAEVWEGRDDVLARPVAIKVLHAHLARDPGFAERFRREAVAAARLAHPNIVSTYDAGTDGDTAFIVMELVGGHTLRQAIERVGTLAAADTVRIGMAVADALDCAHRNGLIHRDVKPANILLTDTGHVLVADFGIAKLEAEAGGELTQTGAIIGTAKYLSPEQVEGHQPEGRSDVYSLGVVLYEMLTGRPPFAADTELATALKHLSGEAVAPRRVVAGIPRPLEAVVLKAMARDPADRYHSAGELKRALAAVDVENDDAEPLVSREPTPPDGVTPLPRRARRGLAPVLVGVLLVAAGIGSAGLLLSPDADDPAPAEGEPAPAAQQLRIARATSFDPEGNRSENEELAPNVLDGDADTVWHSDRYDAANFARLKDGLGLVFRLDGTKSLAELKAFSPIRGWSASVYVAASAGQSLADWGQPVAERSEIGGDVTFDLGGRRGGAVLLWITDPGPTHRAEITDVTLSGS